MVVRDIVTAALRVLGVVASGETPAGQESVDALFSLNRILETLSTDIAYLHDNGSVDYTLVADTREVTLGTGANVDIPVDSVLEALTVDGQQFSFAGPSAVIGQLPKTVVLRNTRPVASLVFGQTQRLGAKVSVYYRAPLPQYATLDDTVNLPTGYVNMLIYLLAFDVAPQYGVTFTNEAAANLRKYETQVKRQNSNASVATIDTRADIMGMTGSFDIYAGA